MPTFDAMEQPTRTTRSTIVRFLLIALAAVGIAHALDGWVYSYVRVEDIYSHDWGRALRVLGFLPLWLVAALALWLHDRPERGAIRAGLLAASATLGGLAAEVLKLIFRRERPGAHEGDYFFRPFTERTFSTSGLALPSSHALVAFGAAAMLARLFPRARLVWWGIAWGCGLSRVAAGAHFFSDIVVAALAGWVVAFALWNGVRGRVVEGASGRGVVGSRGKGASG